jgi:phenylacetate-CoA ligase
MELYECYGQDTFESLQEQLRQFEENPLYVDVFKEAGLDAAGISSWADFRQLPFTKTDDLLDDIHENPPEGSLYQPGSMISFTPAGDEQLPVFETPRDLERYADVHGEIFDRLGIEPGMRAMVSLSYHGFGTGYLLHRALEDNGVEVIPAGPGEAKQKAETIDKYDVDILWGNPSFALEIAEHGGDALDIFIGGGEPFTSIPGQRERVHEAFGDLQCAVDYFGLRQAWPVSVECAAEKGLHVIDDYMIAEIIDPDSGEVLPMGERGEVVLTHIDREAGGLLRYRTGDLSMVKEGTSQHVDGSTVMMSKGVFGRTDGQMKIKGVKVYPGGILLVLAGIDGISTNYQLRVTRPENTDYISLTIEGEADPEVVREELREQLLITPDEIEFVEELEEGPPVVDERY